MVALIKPVIGKLGENMAAPRFVRHAGKGYVGQYIHPGAKVGVQVEFTGVTPELADREEFSTLVKEIAMQIAAATPVYASRDEVPAAVLDKERAIYRAQVEETKKPANIIEKIVEGKLGSYYKQVVLARPGIGARSEDDRERRHRGGIEGARRGRHRLTLRAPARRRNCTVGIHP